jgi:pyruvate/2-oxoglutarate dehydrogenase complex dihydrolipoamide dehydrogenase (E3) component
MGEPEHTDVVVFGLRSGGEYAAGTLTEAGPHVTGVQARLAGGECPHSGCVPSKMMIRAGHLVAGTRRAEAAVS